MNNTISVYDLLGLIKDGKVPKKIKWKGNVLEFDGEDYKYYKGAETLSEDSLVKYIAVGNLNDKVEIINCEKDKPIIEKLKIKDNKVIGKWENGSDYHYTLSAPQVVIINKINQVIDYINRKEDKNN